MSEFAKLYGTGSDQVLVLIQSGETGPEVRVFFCPEDLGLGLCSVALQWENDDSEDWDKAEKAFNAMTEEKAREWLGNIRAELGDYAKIVEAER